MRWKIRELVRYLAEKQIPVEVCITSNVLTGCCAAMAEHPIRRLFDAGVLVTLNTDDPDMFRTTLAHEYQIAQQVFGFSEAELRQLAKNSFRASFLPETKKQQEMLGKVLSWRSSCQSTLELWHAAPKARHFAIAPSAMKRLG